MAGTAGLPTVADIINEALGHIGVYQGDPLAAADLQSAYFTLQALVDGWGAQALTIFSVAVLPFTATAGQQSYTLGPAGATPANNWIAPFLPAGFNKITVTLLPGSPALELPVEIVTADEWAAIPLKSLSSNVVAQVWPDRGAAAHTLNFWPVPNASIPVTLYAPQQVPRFTATSNVVQFPPGYQEAITFELAIKVSSKFGAPLPSWLPEAYAEAKANIKAANFEPLYVECDRALTAGRRSSGRDLLAFYEGR